MKKIYALLIGIVFLTGCSATADISIDKDSVVENVKVSEQDIDKYNKYKNWNGFPVPLYYDQDLKVPLWMNDREKESGVSYYDVKNDDNNKTIEISGKFKLNNHNRSSLVRNCFKLYNVINEGSKTIFSTSKGLTCAFKNFDIKVYTPYTVVTNNADKVDYENNIYTWNINSSSAKNASVYLEVDFSKKYKEDQVTNEDDTTEKASESNTFVYTIIIIITTIIIALGLYFYTKFKKHNTSV